MAAGHQLKRQQSHFRAHNLQRSSWVEYLPKNWSIYTLIFSTTSLLVFCFSYYDSQTYLTSRLPLNAGRQLDALRVQASDLYLDTFLRSPRLSDGDGASEGAAGRRKDRVQYEQTGAQWMESLGKGSEDLGGRDGRKKDRVKYEETARWLESSGKGSEDLGGRDGGKDGEEETTAKADGRKSLARESSGVDDSCDFSVGKWVHDKNYPLYRPSSCPFVDVGFRCVENGRPSDEFQKWRWQPLGCNLPRFNAKKMLERLRGSRLAFVGDSLARNNWESMLCMLAEGISNKSRIQGINGNPINVTKYTMFGSVRFEDYDCAIEYHRSNFLVSQGPAPADLPSKVRSTIKLDQIDESAPQWKTADIVILNTGHWWTYEKTRQSGDYFQVGDDVPLNLTTSVAFRIAMRTVARYIKHSIDPMESQIFFRSYEPHHFKGGTWDNGGTCIDDEMPLKKFPFVYEDKTPNKMILKVLKSLKMRHIVNFLNITYMSELRPDGHNAIWQIQNPRRENHQDCSHWCLPGVPDAWNEIIFATLLRRGIGKWGSS